MRRFFRSPVVDRKEKEQIVAQGFAKFDPIALHAILLLVRKRRETLVDEIVRQYDVLERESRGAEPLQVTSARALTKDELDLIVSRLSEAHHTPFDVTQAVDPKLIGGVRITMGDRVADGTVAGKLDDIARLLSQN